MMATVLKIDCNRVRNVLNKCRDSGIALVDFKKFFLLIESKVGVEEDAVDWVSPYLDYEHGTITINFTPMGSKLVTIRDQVCAETCCAVTGNPNLGRSFS